MGVLIEAGILNLSRTIYAVMKHAFTRSKAALGGEVVTNIREQLTIVKWQRFDEFIDADFEEGEHRNLHPCMKCFGNTGIGIIRT
jgi:hypothetical protein